MRGNLLEVDEEPAVDKEGGPCDVLRKVACEEYDWSGNVVWSCGGGQSRKVMHGS